MDRAGGSSIASEIDDIIFEINLAHDAFISAVIFGKKEIGNDENRSSSRRYAGQH